MNQWIEHEAYILGVDREQIKKTGLHRASHYKILTYNELIKLYQIPDLLEEQKSFNYLEVVRDKIKKDKYIVPTKSNPEGNQWIDFVDYDHEPIKKKGKKKEGLNLIAGDLLPKFSHLTKEFSITKTVRENLEILIADVMKETTTEKILHWVNEYGLPFTNPVSFSSSLTTSLEKDLEISDMFYRLIRFENSGYLPYFMSLNSVLKLSEYSAWLSYGSCLFKIEMNQFSGENVYRPSSEEYHDFCIAFAKYIDGTNISLNFQDGIDSDEKFDESYEITGPGFSVNENKKYFQYSLGNHLSKWISYIIPYSILDDEAEVSFNKIFSCQSLMSLMALEQYSMVVNKNSGYKKCQNPGCIEIFNIQSKRKGSRYCSDKCRIYDFRRRKKMQSFKHNYDE